MKTYLEPVANSDKRIYCVVANQVQAPLTPTATGYREGYEKLVSNGDTKTIFQPPGRVVTQAEHVVSRVRDVMLKEEIWDMVQAGHALKKSVIFDYYCEPITTITLLARDSFELNHVFHLLRFSGVKVHDFHDFNQLDYGDVNYRVRTAIATEPVYAEDVYGLLDYLPLWKPAKESL